MIAFILAKLVALFLGMTFLGGGSFLALAAHLIRIPMLRDAAAIVAGLGVLCLAFAAFW